MRCKSSPGSWVAQAGSYRSDAGKRGNRRSLRDRRVAIGDSASRQAVIASERSSCLETTNVDADLAFLWGRPPPLGTGGQKDRHRILSGHWRPQNPWNAQTTNRTIDAMPVLLPVLLPRSQHERPGSPTANDHNRTTSGQRLLMGQWPSSSGAQCRS